LASSFARTLAVELITAFAGIMTGLPPDNPSLLSLFLAEGRVGFSEKVPVCRPAARLSKNYGLLFKVAFPKPIPLDSLTPRRTQHALY
jgi:hypothetical protein